MVVEGVQAQAGLVAMESYFGEFWGLWWGRGRDGTKRSWPPVPEVFLMGLLVRVPRCFVNVYVILT